jgi:hypothetical protein
MPTVTDRINAAAAAIHARINELVDGNTELDARAHDHGLGACLPLNDGDYLTTRIALDTHAMRDLYRAVLGDRTMCPDLRRMMVANANDMLDSDVPLRANVNGDYRAAVWVQALALAIAQWDRNEADYEHAMESWHERYAEAGSGHVHAGGSPMDAALVAQEVAGAKPYRWWVHAAA